MASYVVRVAMQEGSVLLQVRLQLPPHQLVALLLLELHCRQEPLLGVGRNFVHEESC